MSRFESAMKYLIQHFIEDTFKSAATRTAIKQGDRLFTYGEIDDLSNRFRTFFDSNARINRAGNGMVGILSRVRAEAIVAMIGALKSGVKYVPLNTLAPASWLGSVIRSAGIEVLLVDSAFLSVAESLKEFGVKEILCLDDDPSI